MEYRKGVYLVIEQDGRYLLAHKSSNDKNEFYFPSGNKEEQESDLEAFYREADEELDLQKEDFISVKETGIIHSYELPEEDHEDLGFTGQEKTFIIAKIKSSSIVDVTKNNGLDKTVWLRKEHIETMIPFQDLKKAFLEIKPLLD